jgi:putative hydrolase of the HAD superfamily
MNEPGFSTPIGNPTTTTTRIGETIRTILFDFDGTLVFHRPDSVDVIRAACAEIDYALDEEAERRMRRTRHEYFIDPVVRAELAGLSSAEFWHHFNRHLLEVCGLEGDLDAMAGRVGERFGQTTFHYHCPHAGCRTLAALRARGYDLGLITNRGNVDRFYELLDEMGLRPYFDVTLASGEVGVSKPEPEIFDAALKRLGAEAGASLYVGDNYWADVVGAERAGMAPALLDPHRLFPEAQCLVLDRIDDLLAWLP